MVDQDALCRPRRLVPEAELLDERPVRGQIASLEVREQPAAGSDHLQKPAAAVMILRMGAEMVCKRVDTLGKQRHLYLGRARIGLVGLVLSRHRLLVEAHAAWCPLNEVRVVIRCSTGK